MRSGFFTVFAVCGIIITGDGRKTFRILSYGRKNLSTKAEPVRFSAFLSLNRGRYKRVTNSEKFKKVRNFFAHLQFFAYSSSFSEEPLRAASFLFMETHIPMEASAVTRLARATTTISEPSPTMEPVGQSDHL